MFIRVNTGRGYNLQLICVTEALWQGGLDERSEVRRNDELKRSEGRPTVRHHPPCGRQRCKRRPRDEADCSRDPWYKIIQP